MLSIEIPQSTISHAIFTSPNNKQKNKCPCCNKKLGLVYFTCRCGGNYCAEHRHDSAHNCTFDYMSENKKILTTNLAKVVAEKLDKI